MSRLIRHLRSELGAGISHTFLRRNTWLRDAFLISTPWSGVFCERKLFLLIGRRKSCPRNEVVTYVNGVHKCRSEAFVLGNFYVSEHARSKYGKCACKYQTRALRKSELVLRLRMWLSRKTAAQRSSLTFRTLAIRTEYQSVVDNNGDDDDRDDDGSASLAVSSTSHNK